MSNEQEDSEAFLDFARGGLLRPGALDELSAQVSASGCYIDPRAARLMGKPEATPIYDALATKYDRRVRARDRAAKIAEEFG